MLSGCIKSYMVKLPLPNLPLSKTWTMGILLLYLILFLFLGFLTFLGLFIPELLKAFSYSFVAGGIGATLYSIRMLYYHSHLDDDAKCSYLFSWENVAEDKMESCRVRMFLRDYFDINWVENAKIEKIEGDRAINIHAEKRSVKITLDENKKKAKLEINDGIEYNFQVKKENGKLNVYSDFIDDPKKEFVWGLGWFWFYFNRPILGAFVAFVAYVLIGGGLLTLRQLSPSSQSTNVSLFAIGLGWLAGYTVTELISRLESVASSIFGFELKETPFGRLKELVHSRGMNEEKKSKLKPK